MADRLVQSPIFVISSIRSGSTLLRKILGTHSRIHAPHELHLPDIAVVVSQPNARLSMSVLNLNAEELEHLLWDRLLHHQQSASGKDHIVEKTPGNVFSWKRLNTCWPRARYIFLLRDPFHIAVSAYRTRAYARWHDAVANVSGYLAELNEARHHLAGHTMRYEDLIQRPELEMRHLCNFLGVGWEPQMLQYKVNPDELQYGIGDFTDRIRIGHICGTLPRMPNVHEVDRRLQTHRELLGYVGANYA